MLFINNKYSRWYNSIISKAQNRIKDSNTYYENHHIVPKSLNGSNDVSNIVALTAKEHFICHLLLVKMVEDKRHKTSMQYAVFRMTHVSSTTSNRYKINSNSYKIIREYLAVAASSTHLGRKQSVESRQKRSISLRGRVSPTKGMIAWNRGIAMTDEAKKKASAKLAGRTAWNKGIPASIESNEKRKKKQTGIPKEQLTCPYCKKVGGKPVMIRHHFENCKSK